MRMIIALFLTILPLMPQTLATGGPNRLNYQGILRDAGGDPRQGTFDMRFRFFDAASLGNELLVDEHLAAGTGGVVVTGGLFNTLLGGGNVLDGAGPGVFSSIADVVRAHDAIWLEVEVGGETLAPRVAVQSSAYALNARLLEGKAAGEFLDTSAAPQQKTGLFTASGGVDFGPGSSDDLTAADVGTLTGGGNADALHTHALVGNASNAALLDSIDSSQFLRSDTDDTYTSGTLTTAPGTVLDLRGDTHVQGKLLMNFSGPDASALISFFDGGSPVGESFGWSEAEDRFTLSNTLHIKNGFHLEQTGDSLYIKSAGPDGSQAIYFYDAGAPTGQSISWDDANGEFQSSSDTRIAGTLAVDEVLEIGGNEISLGISGPDQIQKIDFYDQGIAGNEFFMWEDGSDRFRLSNDLYMNGTLNLQGADISMNTSGPDGNQFLRFYEDGLAGAESLNWDDAQDRFELTDDLAIQGVLRTGTTGVAPVAYNAIGSGTATSSDMSSILDLFVSGDLEVGDQLYMGGEHYLQYSTDSGTFHTSTGLHVGVGLANNLMVAGPRLFLNVGAPGNAPTEYLEFILGTFNLSDDLDVNGTLTANSKNFVQNHPYDPSLEIVYTSLEGAEAATFTRGSARLVGGQARVPLEKSFAWVTHPDLGLTVSLTPRGRWADLYVVEVTTSELVVAASPDSPQDATFDYHVMGLHVGYEEAPVLRPRRREATLPEPQSLREQIAGRPELAPYTPLARYRNTAVEVLGAEQVDLSAGDALRAAIGTGPREGTSIPGHDADRSAPSAIPPHAATTTAARSSSPVDEDHQETIPARSFRPSSGGVDAVSPSVGDVAAGDVLAFDPASGRVRRADLADDVSVVGIATGAPTVDRDGNTSVPFTVAGIVVCNADATGTAIRTGDLLVSSPNPGFAMRSDLLAPGTVIGKALDALPSGIGAIRVIVVLR